MHLNCVGCRVGAILVKSEMEMILSQRHDCGSYAIPAPEVVYFQPYSDDQIRDILLNPAEGRGQSRVGLG